MITAFLSELLKMSLAGSLIWILLLFLKPFTGKTFSQTWHYYTGLIPAFFMLGTAQAITAIANKIINPVQNIALKNMSETSPHSTENIPDSIIFFNFDFINPILLKAQLSFENFTLPILIVWLIGFLVFLFRRITAYTRFKNNISRVGKPSTVINCKLPILIYPNTVTPMLVGVFKPVVILPEREYNENELKLILSHETTHWRRGDMLVKWFILIVNALHWFNPIVYLMNNWVARLCENACDESLVRNMSKSERILYGELILSTVSFNKTLALCAGISMEKNLRRRLLNMFEFKKMNKFRKC